VHRLERADAIEHAAHAAQAFATERVTLASQLARER
jgi:hypothetical protein